MSIAIVSLTVITGCEPQGDSTEHDWSWEVIVTPLDTDCGLWVEEQLFTYDVNVDGDQLTIYIDGTEYAQGELRGSYISYEAPAVALRRGLESEIADSVGWQVSGYAHFQSQELDYTNEAEEEISVTGSEEDDIPIGCTLQSETVWSLVESGPLTPL